MPKANSLLNVDYAALELRVIAATQDAVAEHPDFKEFRRRLGLSDKQTLTGRNR